MTNKFLDELLNDYEKLFSNGNNYDVIIEAGENGDTKKFHAHSLILNLRSTYFKAALSNYWTQQENGKFVLKESNIDPKIMELLLKYIYTGIIDLDKQKGSEVLKLFMASNELYFKKLNDCIQAYIIEKQVNFLKEEPVDVLQTVFQYSSLSVLRDFYLKLICDSPEILFSAIKKVDKSLLILLVERNDLNMGEYKIWEHVLKWGISQLSDFVNVNDLFDWTDENFVELGEILHDFIPLIRWTQIPSKLFNQKISPFKKIFSEKFFDDIVGYYIDPDSSPKSILSQPREPSFNSKIINKKHLSIISSWIDNKRKKEYYNVETLPYSFELLYSATRDGFDSTKFHELCDDKGPTLMVAKIKDTGKLIGGYNPESWKFQAISEDNFLFSFENQYNVDSPIIARYTANLNDSSFNHNPRIIDLSDLTIKNDTIKCNSTKSFPKIKSFIRIGQNILMEDCEVFKIIKLSKLINYEVASKGKFYLMIGFIGNSIIAILPNSLGIIFQKFYSTVNITLRKYVNTFQNDRIISTVKFYFQRDKFYSIIKLIIRECANILAIIFTKDRIHLALKLIGGLIIAIIQGCVGVLAVLLQRDNVNLMAMLIGDLTIAIVIKGAEILDNNSSIIESVSKPIITRLQRSFDVPVTYLRFITEFSIIFAMLSFFLSFIKIFFKLDLVYPKFIFYLTLIVCLYLLKIKPSF